MQYCISGKRNGLKGKRRSYVHSSVLIRCLLPLSMTVCLDRSLYGEPLLMDLTQVHMDAQCDVISRNKGQGQIPKRVRRRRTRGFRIFACSSSRRQLERRGYGTRRRDVFVVVPYLRGEMEVIIMARLTTLRHSLRSPHCNFVPLL